MLKQKKFGWICATGLNNNIKQGKNNMGKLSGARVYLAGSIDKSDDLGRGWRNDITPFLESLGIFVLDPCKKPINIFYDEDQEKTDEGYCFHKKIDEWREGCDYDSIANIFKKIRSVDLRMVDISDFLIVYLDLSVFNCGTLEEVFWANRLKRPVLLVCSKGKKNCPGWLFGTIPHEHIFNNFSELKDYLENISLVGPDIDDNRWILFDYEKLSKKK